MCGAFVLFAVGDPAADGRRLPLHAAYHGGRLITYTALGAIAGLLGAAFDFGGSLVGVQRAAAILAGAMMVGFGTIAILRIQGVRVPKPPIPRAWERVLTAGHRFAAGRPPIVRALATGLLTTLLPCGWLYAFVITAAGTASPALGALTMVAFWVGTVPVLVALGTGLRAIMGALGRRLPTLTAAAVVVVGLATIIMRAGELGPTSLSPDDPALCGSPVTLPTSHAGSVGP
jgi:sulfite exporter TauE/SafE